ncbi:MAG: RnfABCDGE type electron transport complex subunit B [Proteobacteria bacterium]|nr:RnfABCDGE type electron transport complex subunit B [Pseudomonadota bacterium]
MSSFKAVRIVEEACIGCTKCVSVCPVDAIVGASQVNHAVLTEFCIGCELCLPPCPVNCIEIFPILPPENTIERAQVAKNRVHARKARLAKEENVKNEKDNSHIARLQDEIASSMARISERKKNQWVYDE